jgi:uncharacterized membrane protein YgaE (UPF0421/DUF939 family)
VASAVAHFITGYVWARAIMTPQLSAPLAMAGTIAAGAYTWLAIVFGTPEFLFAPLGPIVALALGDASSARNMVSSVVAFAIGFVLLIWLTP